MSWKEYKEYKEFGRESDIAKYKAPWVLDWWDCIDLNEKQYAIYRKTTIIFETFLCSVLCIVTFFLGYFLRGVK